MKPLILSVALAVMLAGVACSGDDSDDTASPTPGAGSHVAATAAPSAAPTEGSSTPAAGGYRAERVWPDVNFDRMVGVHFFPDDPTRAVVLTQMEGVIRSFSTGSASAVQMFLDLSDKLITDPGNEEGLLGFAFAPDYEQSHRVYVYYTAGEPRRSVIARYVVANGAADPASEHVILEIPEPYPNHNGGALEFGPDGMLYVALGDGGAAGDPHGNGQNLDALLGKILRIDVSGEEYTVPADNPFVGQGRGEVWAYGLRNPWRITFDRQTGDLWAGDVGQSSWEEVDRITRGGNYGWNEVEGPACFAAQPPCQRPEWIAPRASYPTGDGCAITGGYVYRGTALPELRGWYVYADFCTGRVLALDASSPTSDPVVLMQKGDQAPSFAEDDEGELYLVTFGNAIYRLARVD